jgi:hypothetical protein
LLASRSRYSPRIWRITGTVVLGSGFVFFELTQELAQKTEELGIASKQEQILTQDLEDYRYTGARIRVRIL